VLSNLLSNAVAHGAGKPVRISVREADGWAVIAVADQGPGIAPAEHEQLFQRFERGTGSERAGYGLGLWIVRQLVQLHGGVVSVRSAPGQGATFEVKLPCEARR
jgi:signal transduction histidine kinase